MKNKVKLKKYIVLIVIVYIALLFMFLALNIYELNVYNKNYNIKILEIVNKVKEDYPNISENEIIEILNSKNSNEQIFKKYGIDILKDNVLLENEKIQYVFILLNIGVLVIAVAITIIIFTIYEKDKDKELKEITKYIEEINRKNYSLKIDGISEDELSILKNEIYKTTIMLKESAENSKKDKIELKKSLEDISHQIKTPLTSILIILDNLIDNPNMDESTRYEFIRDVKREVVNINFLIQAILKLSSLESNTVSYIKEKNNINTILESAIKNVSTLCDLKNVEIELKDKPDIELVCDSKWQIEALTNILKNCIEHSKSGGKVIISCENNNAYIQLVIKDFGDGISKKDLPHIFERFYKGENSTPDSIGIGLALSKAIIEQDNGKIDVKSDKDGTQFIIKYFRI